MTAGQANPDLFFMKYLAVLFTLFIIAVVVLADLDAFPPCIRKLYDFPNGDKVGHLILFGLLNFFLTSAFLFRFPLSRGRVALSVSLILILAIAAEEFSQQYFAARTFDLVDLSASYIGAFVGGWIAWRFIK